jgi:hypothetical protein
VVFLAGLIFDNTMNFLRERTASLNLRERTARLSQNANEWREKFQTTSGTTASTQESPRDHRNDSNGDVKVDTIASTSIGTHGWNSNDDASVLTSVTALIEAAKAQQEQYQLDMADPDVVATMQKSQAVRSDLRSMRQTYRFDVKERNRDLGSINQKRNAVGRELWLKMQNNKLNPYVLKDYREELLKLSLPEHDTTNPTLTAETKLLRANHNGWMTERQMAIVHKLQECMIDYMYNEVLPNIKKEREVATTVARAQVDKMQTSKKELENLYQSYVQTQEAILAKYREKVSTGIFQNKLTNPGAMESGDSVHGSDSDSDDDKVLLTRKGKKAQFKGTDGENVDKSLMIEEDARSSNETPIFKVESDNMGSRRSVDGKDSQDGSDEKPAAAEISSSPAKPAEESHNSTVLHNATCTEKTNVVRRITSPQLTSKTGMAARIAERAKDRLGSAEQHLRPERTAPMDVGEAMHHHHATTARNIICADLEKKETESSHKSHSPTSKAKESDDAEPTSRDDEFQRREPRRTVSLSDRRSVGGRIGMAGRGTRSGLLERARNARMQGAAALDGKQDAGARPDITGTAIGYSTTTGRPSLSNGRSLSKRDVEGGRSIGPSLQSSSTTEGQMNSRRNLTQATGSSSRRLNGNGEVTSGLSEERRAQIRSQLRNSVSKDSSTANISRTPELTKPTAVLSSGFDSGDAENNEKQT